MEAITFEDAVECIRTNLEKDSSLIKSYDIVVKTLGLLFKREDVKESLQLDLSEEEVIEYAKRTILSFLGNQMTLDDIHKVELIPGSSKKLRIRANAHFDPDESYSCLDAELTIKNKIKIFTGYDVDIDI